MPLNDIETIGGHLKEAIERQQKDVNDAEAELESAREIVRQWEQTLSVSKAKLDKLKNSLKHLTGGSRGMKTATHLPPPTEIERELARAKLRESSRPGLMCGTCGHYNGLMGECERFGVDMKQVMLCDEWTQRKGQRVTSEHVRQVQEQIDAEDAERAWRGTL